MKQGVTIYRDENGLPHVEADNLSDVFWGQGYVHAKDRGMQILLMKILAQGRASELLDSSDETLEIDKFFRKMNWAGNIKEQLNKLTSQEKEFLDAYCDGINSAFQKKYPWEFKLLGYKPEKWKPEDCIVISRMVGYLTLAQSQTEMERFFVELVQANIPEDKLEELFPGLLGGLDIDLIKTVSISERIVEPSSLWNQAIPRMMASNNWVVAGDKTASGKPIVCNDPHLEINRLPNVWCEVVLKYKSSFMSGGSMPGLPGVLAGRTNDIAWGVTYAFIDACDSWIEKCKNGCYYREEDDSWNAFEKRQEIIKRKKKDDYIATFYENDHGALDGDPTIEGNYLSTLWAASSSGAATLSAIFGLWDLSDIDKAMDYTGKIETGWSVVMANSEGDIAFQMSGLVPKRREGISGFIPLPGWKKENDWQGFHSHLDLPRLKNPEKGYFSTANQDLNEYGNIKPINMPMGKYRSDRIDNLLHDKKNLTKDEMFEMHKDVYSLQAELFMDILKPLLPDTQQGKILRDWDFCYDKTSEGAFLFERVYIRLYSDVFGQNGFGETVIDYLAEDTGVFIDFYDSFDRILLSESSLWFGDKTRDEIYKTTAAKALDVKPEEWGTNRKFTLTNILFAGKLPAFIGFDRGPITAIGGRATIHQGQIYKSAGRDTTFMPSLRMVSDLSEEECYTNIAGGPSDRRFSKWYCSDLQNWIDGKYKTVTPEMKTKLKF